MARASALHAEGQGFDSLILHQKTRVRKDERTRVRQVNERKRIRRTKYKHKIKVKTIQRSYNLLESE